MKQSNEVVLALQQQLLKEREEKTRNGVFYISDCGSCERKLFWDLLGNIPKEDFSIDVLFKFQQGNLIHQKIQAALRKHGIQIDEEVEIKDNHFGFEIHGRCDSILCIPKTNQKKILEIKSISDYGFKQLLKTNKPQTPHTEQLQLYLFYFKHLKPTGILLYENKNNQQFLEFNDIKLDMNIVKRIIKQFSKIQAAVERKEVPERPEGYFQDKYPCSWCQYKKHCWGKRGDLHGN